MRDHQETKELLAVEPDIRSRSPRTSHANCIHRLTHRDTDTACTHLVARQVVSRSSSHLGSASLPRIFSAHSALLVVDSSGVSRPGLPSNAQISSSSANCDFLPFQTIAVGFVSHFNKNFTLLSQFVQIRYGPRFLLRRGACEKGATPSHTTRH